MWVRARSVFDGEQLRECALRIEGGRVVEIGDADGLRVEGLITPGFVDLQVNGGGGVLVNNDPTPEGIAAVAAAHRRFGTVALMPTVITDAPGVMERAAEAVIGCDAPGVLGLHIEGPHISLAKRGTHAAEWVRPFEAATLEVVKRLHEAEHAVMVTVAPEGVSPGEIGALVDAGAVVSLGHTDADAETVQAALGAGARCGTHLFNAMSQVSARAPGAVGALMAHGCAGIIADGHHVDLANVALAFARAPAMFLVSDAMATVGGSDSFELYGQTIRVDGGRLVNAEGNLAGAHTTMAEGLRNVIGAGVSMERALRAVTSVPASVIGVPETGTLVGRDLRDILVLDDGFQVRHTLAEALEEGPI